MILALYQYMLRVFFCYCIIYNISFILFFNIKTFLVKSLSEDICVIISGWNISIIKLLWASNWEKQRMASQETVNPAQSRANHAFMKKRKKVLWAMNAEDGLELIIRRFEKCRDLWKTVQLKHKEYISVLDQNDKELLETEENLLIKIHQTFFALERTNLNNQKQQNHDSDQVRLEEQKREEEQKYAKLKRDKEISVMLIS